jgi:hypothetical protein
VNRAYEEAKVIVESALLRGEITGLDSMRSLMRYLRARYPGSFKGPWSSGVTAAIVRRACAALREEQKAKVAAHREMVELLGGILGEARGAKR